MEIAKNPVAKVEGFLRRRLVRDNCGQLKARIGGQDQLVNSALEKLLAHPRFESILAARIGLLQVNLFGPDRDQRVLGCGGMLEVFTTSSIASFNLTRA